MLASFLSFRSVSGSRCSPTFSAASMLWVPAKKSLLLTPHCWLTHMAHTIAITQRQPSTMPTAVK